MRKYISILLVIFALLSVMSAFSATTVAVENTVSLKTGDIIEFGSYPQSKVTDEKLIESLNKIEAEWVSLDCYYEYDVTTDAIKYKDVEYRGERYRAVTFSIYRPYHVNAEVNIITSYQHKCGYDIDTVYWFKYDPIQWRVLDPNTGLVMSEYIIDAIQFYQNDYKGKMERDGELCFTNSYKHSDIRNHLINNIYNVAFTDREKELLVPTTLNSNDYTRKYSVGNDDVTDSIFLLSYSDMINPAYGFNETATYSDSARFGKSTDYTQSQGIYVYSEGEYAGYSIWFTRSAGALDRGVVGFNYFGGINNGTSVFFNGDGTRPAIHLNMSSLTSCDLGNHKYVDYTCINCGKKQASDIMGDVNGDYKVNAIDSNLMAKIILGSIETDDNQLILGDLNSDNKINAIDVNMLKKLILGQ